MEEELVDETKMKIFIVNWIYLVCWRKSFELGVSVSSRHFFSSIGLNYVVISLNHWVAINREFYYILKWRKWGLMYHERRAMPAYGMSQSGGESEAKGKLKTTKLYSWMLSWSVWRNIKVDLVVLWMDIGERRADN